MTNFFKRVVFVFILVLILLPVIGFQEASTLEPSAAAAVIEEKTISIAGEGTSSSPEADVQQPEVETEKLNSNEIMEERRLYAEKNIRDEKVAYLTFDDGPSPLVTPKILETLKQHGIKATFFIIGKMAEQNPELVRQIQEEGHLICNHTYSHNYKLIYTSPDNFMADVARCEEVLKNILGDDFKTGILRFPAGSFGKKRLPFRKLAKENGYMSIDWNSLNGDAEALHIPADVLVNKVKETIKNRKKAVVLMHDSNTKDTTAEALPAIISYLESEGYAFKTLENYEL